MLTMEFDFLGAVGEIFYAICKGVSSVLDWLFSFLPNSPFKIMSLPDNFATIMGYINYFIPLNEMLVIVISWLGCIISFYIIQLIMKFFKVVASA